MEIEASAVDLCRFIDAAPCPALAADEICLRLSKAGFRGLDLADPDWNLVAGRYFLRRGASVVAFAQRGGTPNQYAVVGAHTDSPHLRLKPRAPYLQEDCKQFAVEVYGRALWNSWLDRDLGLAGTVFTVDGEERRVRLHRPLARVAQLAIHLDSRVNEEGLKLNPQLHLAPIWGLRGEPEAEFQALLAETAGVGGGEIAAYDLSLYDLMPAALGGASGELIFAPRLDNLASCHAGLLALLEAAEGGTPGSLAVLACLDHEEVGSESEIGAGGAFLGTVLERIAAGCGLTRTQHLAALACSLMLSADMAHGVHPNYADRHEPHHKPRLGAGPVLKTNHGQRYATTHATAAYVRSLARAVDTPLQDFASRSDLSCGTTIGPICAARLGMAVADLGTPMLSMHSARECAATADHAPYIRLLAAHLRG